MEEGKFKRVVVELTVGAVLLLTVLLSVMVYQIVAILNSQRELAELERKITEYNEIIKHSDDVIEERSAYQWIVMRARQLGYYFDGDKIYKNDGNK